jgi:hypothetical protein
MKGRDGQKLAVRSRENHRRLIVTLFTFASQQRYISRENAAEIAEIDGLRVSERPTEIFTPEQIQSILNPSSTGKISRYTDVGHLSRQFSAIATECGVPWVRNGLRHSFCSYRLAQTKNAAQTAHEAGNSPSILHRHYSELVTQNEAEQWFNVMPCERRQTRKPTKSARVSVTAV